jgi:hypothetical protein
VRTTTYVSPWSSALATLKPERTNVNAPFASGPHGVQSVLTCRPARAGPIRSSAEVTRLLNRLRCMLHVTVAAGASSVSSPLKVPWGRLGVDWRGGDTRAIGVSAADKRYAAESACGAAPVERALGGPDRPDPTSPNATDAPAATRTSATMLETVLMRRDIIGWLASSRVADVDWRTARNASDTLVRLLRSRNVVHASRQGPAAGVARARVISRLSVFRSWPLG